MMPVIASYNWFLDKKVLNIVLIEFSGAKPNFSKIVLVMGIFIRKMGIVEFNFSTN
jgi:hypothetical protein